MPKKTETKKPKTKVYGNYSNIQLGKALGEIRRGKLNFLQASKKYSVPRSTLRDKIKGSHPQKRPGPPNSLPLIAEQELKKWIVRQQNSNMSVNQKMATEKIGLIMEALSLTFPTGKHTPSRGWWRGF